jgi:ATP-dependent Lhr-like helicase
VLTPAIAAPAAYATESADVDRALAEIVRGRLEGLGPTTPAELAQSTGLAASALMSPLTALEVEGFALRGRFTPGATEDEWCERRLLARIHQRTVKRLRAEIEPVPARDFLRFLLDWQRVTPETQMEGPAAVDMLVGQLEGFEAAASAWESEILPARLVDYEPSWLDDRCMAGQVTWARLRPRTGKPSEGTSRAGPVRGTPIALFPRRYASLWASLVPTAEEAVRSPKAQAVLDHIRQHGASFFDELVDATHLLRSQVEDALGELVSLGLLTSDSFGGLRALLVPSAERRPAAGGRRRRRTVGFGIEDAGRWALAKRPPDGTGATPEAIEHIAQSLLRRYGVVFWRLLEREAAWLPPWRELLRVYRTLESRGDIRGGRFVAGFSGEQFALPEAVGELRRLRREPQSGALISISGADPLNLVGVLTPGAKLPALANNRLLYRDGLPIAVLASGEAKFMETLDPATEWEAHKILLRGAMRVPPTAPADLGEHADQVPVLLQ